MVLSRALESGLVPKGKPHLERVPTQLRTLFRITQRVLKANTINSHQTCTPRQLATGTRLPGSLRAYLSPILVRFTSPSSPK